MKFLKKSFLIVKKYFHRVIINYYLFFFFPGKSDDTISYESSSVQGRNLYFVIERESFDEESLTIIQMA